MYNYIVQCYALVCDSQPFTVREHIISLHILRKHNAFQIGQIPCLLLCSKPLSHIFEHQLTQNDTRVSGRWSKKQQDCEWWQEQSPLNHNRGKNSCPLFVSFYMASFMSGKYECTCMGQLNLFASCTKRHKLCTTTLSKGVYMNHAHPYLFVSMYTCRQHALIAHTHWNENVWFVLGIWKLHWPPIPFPNVACFLNMCELMLYAP